MLWAVIMAGGQGTRFWPESRNKTPKQFLPLFGVEPLIKQTVDRLAPVIPLQRVIVVTQADKVSLVKRLLKLPASQVIGEPVGRNTAPCMVLAAAMITRKDPDAVLALLPADNRIEKEAVFRKALRVAAGTAKREALPVTFGIKPTYPCTGYGYLETGKKTASRQGKDIYRLKQFHEKPGLVQARRFLRTKRFLWNSGMFVWKGEAILREAREHLPRSVRLSEKIIKESRRGGMKKYFKKMPNISIDFGLMEKMKGRILTMPVDIGWSDLGGWRTLHELGEKDKEGNVVKGDCVLVGSSGNFIQSGGRLIALVGVENHVIIDSGDVLLVCAKDRTEEIRRVVAELKRKQKWKKYL